ncbi:hypothetical protein GCM10022240_12810 [Microbacterium kribbense]|uniref:General stress protein 17M-like domain-containing protein n=1 Tax=Microbacterium kribbense TaxID=433645 RepID=A0ABP7GIS9_9MICO
MSMPGRGAGRAEVGETVADFPAYEAAQKAVSALIAGGVPARDIAIVGTGLRSIERITGRLGYATAARQGAINGVLLGLFFSAIFVLGNPAAQVSVFIGVLFIGVALGMLVSIGGYAIIRRRRDFASVMQVVADHYEVTVLPASIHRARELLGPMAPGPQRPPTADDAATRPPRYGERVDAEPPRYGERAPVPPAVAAHHGRHGGHPHEAPAQPESHTPAADEPPRFGQRLPAPGAQPAARPGTPAEPTAKPPVENGTADDGTATVEPGETDRAAGDEPAGAAPSHGSEPDADPGESGPERDE